MSLDGRTWAVLVGETLYEDIDVRASVRYPRDGGRAETQLTVYLPSPILVEQVRARMQRVSVLAGYTGEGGRIEIGGGIPVANSIEYDRVSIDQPLTATLAESPATGSLVLSAAWKSIDAASVLAWVSGEAGLVLDNQATVAVQYERGYYIDGTVSAVVAELADDLGCEWQIDGPTLSLWPAGSARKMTATRWSADTGLMWSGPSSDAGEIRATARLYPGLRRGDIVSIIDDELAGDFVAREVSHEIDTQGDTWMTSIAGRPRG